MTYHVPVIDDGPFVRLMIERSVKRFDLDIALWPTPPERGGGEWGTYWNYRVEEVIFKVGLLVRKLIEADKLSVEAQSQRLSVRIAPLRGDDPPGKMNYHHLERFYDLDAARDIEISVADLCNALVHSFILVPCFEVSTVGGLRLTQLFLASDRGRRNGVFIISWVWFVATFVRSICADHVVASMTGRLPHGEHVQINSCRTNVSIPALVVAYCALSDYHRKRYQRLIEHLDEQGIARSAIWPSLEEASAAIAAADPRSAG